MNFSLLRYSVVLLLVIIGLLRPVPTHATITCTSAVMGAVTFAAVNPLSSQTSANAQLTYKCSNNDLLFSDSAMLCFSIGEPGGGPTNPRQMTAAGGHILQFQLYQNATFSTIWGSQFFGSDTPLMVPITLGPLANTTGHAVLYAQVLNGQVTAVPNAAYVDTYASGDTAITVNSMLGTTAPAACNGTTNAVYFPFTVSASVVKQCVVSAGSNLNLGAVPFTATNITGNNLISVTCSNTTPYYVGLSPSNGNTTGAGIMKGSINGNTDQVPYQLRSTAGIAGTIWGNTATSTSIGNGVASTGNGLGQSLTVYATVSNVNYTPDTYSDTVTVNVNY